MIDPYFNTLFRAQNRPPQRLIGNDHRPRLTAEQIAEASKIITRLIAPYNTRYEVSPLTLQQCLGPSLRNEDGIID